MIELHPLAKDAMSLVAHIAVTQEQEPFCGTIAGHFADADPAVDFHRILCDGRAIGFFKIDRAYAERYDFACPGELGLRGVMIDAAEQGSGSGTAAMTQLRDYLPPHYPEAAAVLLTVNVVNPAALAVYRKAGFDDTGALYRGGRIGPQIVMRLDLR